MSLFFQCLSINEFKVMSLYVKCRWGTFGLEEVIKHITALEHLEDLKMKFSRDNTPFNNADDILVAISAGCKNLKKLSLLSE